MTWKTGMTTTCSGHLSEADTPEKKLICLGSWKLRRPQGHVPAGGAALYYNLTNLFGFDRRRGSAGLLLLKPRFFGYRRGFTNDNLVGNHLITFLGIIHRHWQTGFDGLHRHGSPLVVNVGGALRVTVVRR